jgi:hypothetical protein
MTVADPVEQLQVKSAVGACGTFTRHYPLAPTPEAAVDPQLVRGSPLVIGAFEITAATTTQPVMSCEAPSALVRVRMLEGAMVGREGWVLLVGSGPVAPK